MIIGLAPFGDTSLNTRDYEKERSVHRASESELEPPPPHPQAGGGGVTHSLAGEKMGCPNSDERTVNVVL